MASMLYLDNPDWTEIHARSTMTFQEWRLLFHKLYFNILVCKIPQKIMYIL